MNKLILPALAVTVLAAAPAFAGETTLHVKTETTPAVTTTTSSTTTTGVPAVETPASPLKGDPGVTVSTPEVTLEKTTEAEGDGKVEKEVVKPENYTLKDGTKILVDAGSVYVVTADNAKTPAPDGDHLTDEGKTLKVKGGLLITDVPAATTITTTDTAITTPAVTTTTVTEEKKETTTHE